MKGIYAYVDTMGNSVVYVGKDSNIDKNRRRIQHMQPSLYNAQRFNRVLQNNPNRYEYKEIFVFEDISDTKLNHLEMQQIALFNPKFNFTKGGDGVSGYKHTEEFKKRVSQKNKGRKHSEEVRKKISKRFKGIPLSDEHRKKLSEAHKGMKLSETTKKKMSKARNTTGYFRVCKHINRKTKQGFAWEYLYYENNKQKCLSSVNIEKLEAKVKARGLEWYKLDEVLE